MMKIDRKGAIAWEYIAAIIIAIVVLIIILIFTTGLKDIIVEGIRNFGKTGLGR